jgi:hypothetical protein
MMFIPNLKVAVIVYQLKLFANSISLFTMLFGQHAAASGLNASSGA